MIIGQKYILSSLIGMTLLSFSSQSSLGFCCGDSEKEEDTERKSLLHKKENPTFVSAEPKGITSFEQPRSASASASLSTLGAQEDSLLSSSSLNSTYYSYAGQEFEASGQDMISYLSGQAQSEAFNIKSASNKWTLTATVDSKELRLVIIYLRRDHLRRELLDDCFQHPVPTGRSIRETLIAPPLRAHLERSNSEFYKRLVGALYSLHNQAKGSIFSVVGKNHFYSENIFEVKNSKAALDYSYVCVLTGVTTSSNLKTKENATYE